MTNHRLHLIAASVLALNGCAQYQNLVHREFVRMDAARPTFAEDAEACRAIAEGPDYFGEAMGQAIARGVVGGVAGGIAGGVVGNQFGSASLGASVGATVAATSAAAVNPNQGETATIVWARCMASRGYPIYSVKWH